MRLSFVGSTGWFGSDVLVALAVAVGVEDERGPALRLLFVAGLVEHLRVRASRRPGPPPLVHSVLFASSANIRWCVPKQVLMCVSFFVFGSYIASWRPERVEREQLRRRMRRSRLAERRIVGRTHGRRDPHASLLVEHRVVDVVLARPERVVAPVRRRRAGRRTRRRLASFGSRTVSGTRLDRVVHRIEHGEIVGAQLERAVDQAVRVERRVAPVGRDVVVQVRLRIGPVPLGDDDVALDALRTRAAPAALRRRRCGRSSRRTSRARRCWPSCSIAAVICAPAWPDWTRRSHARSVDGK